MLSSLPLQVVLYFNGWYDFVYTLIMLVLYIWKGTSLPYPAELGGLLALEVCLVILLAIIEYARIFLASRGNKTEKWMPIMFSCVLSLPSVYLFFFYFMYQQVYVTRLDVVLASTGLGFIGIELFLSIFAIITLMRAPPASS